MKIVKFKKTGKSKYKLYLENNQTLSLYEDIIMKHNLILKKEIDNNEINKLVKENINYSAYDLALNFISIRLRSKKEIENYLLKKEIDKNIVDFVISKLENEGYLDDYRFSKAYLNDSIELTPKGPYKIKNELIKYGVDNSIISELLEDIDDSTLKEKLYNLMEKQLRIKKGSKTEVKLKLINYFSNLGYDKKMILDILSKFIIETDISNLQKEYNKLYTKYKKKYDGNILDKLITSKLYSKGYSLDEISKVKQAN